jgi:aminopeptidase N
MKVLSTNSYQKGGWTLNMLRHKLGDELFWKGIQTYYATYMNSNAMTEDLKNVMESVSGQELDQFFEQWVFTKGYPELDVSWKYRSGKISGKVSQLQNHYTFKFPLELGITIGDKTEIMMVEVNAKNQSFEFPVSAKPTKVDIDPDVWLLFKD